MSLSRFAPRLIVLPTLCLFVASQARCIAQTQPADATTNSGQEIEDVRVRRQAFQGQQLITSRPYAWIFQPDNPPQIVWRDPQTVHRLGGTVPLHVRWFDGDLEEHAVPDAPGRWGLWVESTAPNGWPLRRAMTFYSPPTDALDDTPPARISISLPTLSDPIRNQILHQHEAEISGLLDGLLFRAMSDSETGAVMMAGIAESQPLGRPARYLETAAVRNDDYHLALKLKLQGLEDRVRPPQPPRQRHAPAVALHQGTPSEAGVHANAKARIDAICRAWADETGEPFVTLVARHGVIVTHEAFGNDIDGRPIDVTYRCWVGSITKTVTALLFSQFVDQRLIDLDDSLATVFPDYPPNDPRIPTFRQCLNHTSGLSGHGNFGEVRNPHLENVILNAIDVNEPNARYEYSGIGFELAARAMEIVAGKSSARLYHEYLFQPLGFGDVPIGNASSDGEFTAMELAILAQWVANRGSYGDLEFISPPTFDRLLPQPLARAANSNVTDEGIGLHWDRRLKAGADPNSTSDKDLLFSPRTVRHGSFSGCVFVIDLDQQIVIAQARRRNGPDGGGWSARFFQTIADVVADQGSAPP